VWPPTKLQPQGQLSWRQRYDRRMKDVNNKSGRWQFASKAEVQVWSDEPYWGQGPLSSYGYPDTVVKAGLGGRGR
jgi:hypothetical protein